MKHDLLAPTKVLAQISAALPESIRPNVIIIGSLAAGYHFFSGDGPAAIRTKDVDCMLVPSPKAVAAAVAVTQQLLALNWKQREDPTLGTPGDANVETHKLPMIRLVPPAGSAWFLEMMAAPATDDPGNSGKQLTRVHTNSGDFAICSFEYLALVEWKPLETEFGLNIARPEMMALSNLLHHPVIKQDIISGTEYKRSNKDLGRVLALAHLTIANDSKSGTNELSAWPLHMRDALQAMFGDRAGSLAKQAGTGLTALLSSPSDLNQALKIANLGLLASANVTIEAIKATGRRVQTEVLDALSELEFNQVEARELSGIGKKNAEAHEGDAAQKNTVKGHKPP